MTASLVLLVANEQEEGCKDNPRTETLLTQVAVRADRKGLLAARMYFAFPRSLLGIRKREKISLPSQSSFRQRVPKACWVGGWKNRFQETC